jgi:hypothetical protein
MPRVFRFHRMTRVGAPPLALGTNLRFRNRFGPAGSSRNAGLSGSHARAKVTIGLQCWQYTMTLLSVYVEGCKNESARRSSAAAVLPFA